MKKKNIRKSIEDIEEDIYSDEWMDTLVEDDEISAAELGFMKGYTEL